ncbi:Protein daughter of sevenless [Clonorchis sinensis]|uniref:Protein daughter of sevenless n=1 Tax=Clonorchis sinensis TaxID=79923 RepID=A0A8T1MTN2_CLOSI|nr:Protein daughter of sevenless [Clonorchis sinensis]
MDFNSFHAPEQQKEIIISGFLIKSPPSVEENRPFSSLWDLGCGGLRSPLIKKRWRQRFCVLYKVRSRDTTGIFFEYYKDKQCHKLKGHVDLKNCECIADDYQIGKWLNVFSIHTKHKGKSRIYYFSAPDPQSMSDWVRHLVEVKGFVDNSQPVEPAYPPYPSSLQGTQGTWDTRQRRVALNQPLPSPVPLSSTHRSSNPSVVTVSHPTLTHPRLDDGYRDPPVPGNEYLLSASEAEKDGYYPLPPLKHSYVNLTDNGDQQTDVSCGDGYSFLPPPQSTIDPQSAESSDPLPVVPPRPARQTSNTTDPAKIQPKQQVTERTVQRSESSDSVYFNVWEAGVQDNGNEVDKGPGPPNVPPKGSPLPTAAKPKKPLAARPVRMFRRDERLSQYHQIPFAPPNPTVSDYANDSTSVPLRPRSPPPPPPARNPAATTLPPNFSCTKPSSEHTIARAPCTDPAAFTCTLQVTKHSTIPTWMQSVDNPMRRIMPSSRNPDLTAAQQSTRRMQQLNYIEPCNLEIGSQRTNGNIPRPVPPKRLPKSKVQDVQATSSCPTSTVTASDSPAGPADYYKIEYKEIDPIETNALAIASKRYLDDDAPL